MPSAEIKEHRLAYLDGIRGVAILLTVFLHYVSRGGYFSHTTPLPIYWLLDSFWSGVDIFFVLSGFLIGGRLIENRDASNFFTVFYVRRALRIFPIAFATIAFSYFALPAFGITHVSDQQVPLYAYLLFINNFWTASGTDAYPPLGPMWSLAIEEQFYLIAPAVILFLRSPRVVLAVLVLIILASPIMRLINLGYSSWDFTFCRLDGFGTGILVALLLRNPAFLAYSIRNHWKIRIMTAGMLLAALCFSMSSELNLSQRIAFGISLNSLATASTIVYVSLYRCSQLRLALSRQWLVVLGQWSYFIYLMHMPVLICIRASSVPTALQPLLAFCISLICAWVSWRYIESPLIHIGKKHEYVKG